jgi:membrane protease YdiL (CAAX protease family)
MERQLHYIDYGLMTAGGLVVLVAVAWWWRRGRGDPLRGSPMRPNHLGMAHVWLCVTVNFVGWWLGAKLGGLIAPTGMEGERLRNWESIFAANFTQVLNAVTCLLVAQEAFRDGLRGFGLGRRRPLFEILMGIAGWLTALFLTGVSLLVTGWILDRFFPGFEPKEHGVFQALGDPNIRWWMQALALGGAFLLAPIGEELLFRGIIQTSIQKLIPPRYGSLLHRWAAIVVTGTLFGFVHMTTPQYVPALILLGILLGFLYERTGSLAVPVLVHMLFNGKSLLWNLLSPHL